jgi:hypothetical protein
MPMRGERGLQQDYDMRSGHPHWTALGMWRRHSHAARWALWHTLALTLLLGAQRGAPENPQPGAGAGAQQAPPLMSQQSQNPFGQFGDMSPEFAERQLRALNVQRQKSMESDAARLLKLAVALHEEVSEDAAGKRTAAELREVGEIQKLARSVRQKMSVAVGDGPVFHEPFAAPMR